MMAKHEETQKASVKALEDMTASLKQHTTSLQLPTTTSNVNERKELSVTEEMRAVVAKLNGKK